MVDMASPSPLDDKVYDTPISGLRRPLLACHHLEKLS